jgi:hypothetical protein
MKEVHKNMGVSEANFNTIVNHLTAAMTEF